MASENVLELTDHNFEQEVVKSDKPVSGHIAGATSVDDGRLAAHWL